MKFLPIFAYLLLSVCFVEAQNVQWIDTDNYSTDPPNNPISNSAEETVEFVLPTSDGGYLLVGQYLWDTGNVDMVARKVNAFGTSQSFDLHGSPREDVMHSAVEYDGHYYVTGSYSYHDNMGNFIAVDCFLGKYDLNLNLVNWTTYFFPGYEHFVGTSIIVVNNEIIIGGVAKSNNGAPYPAPPTTEGAIFKVSPTDLSVQQVNTNLGMSVFKLEPSGNGNFYVFGEYFDVNNNDCNQVYDGPVVVYVVGDVAYDNGYYSDIFVQKYTSNFSTPSGWNGFKLIGGDTPESYVDAIATPDGGFAILGYTGCESNFGQSGPNNVCTETGNFKSYWLYKGSSSGNFNWDRSIDIFDYGSPYGPFGIINSCTGSNIILCEQQPAFASDLNIWSSHNSANETSLGATNTEIIGRDLKRGLNGEIVIGGTYNYFGSQDLGFSRHSDNACSNICDNIIPIQCNSPYFGNNAGLPNLETGYSCNTFTFNAGEQVFEYYHDGNSPFEITLSSSNIDHDIFLFKNCNGGLNNCLGQSINPVSNGINFESISPGNLPAGYYYIVVDGENVNTVGPYTLTISCCSEPTEYDNCGVLTYEYNNFNLNYTFSASQLNNYASDEDWRINGNDVGSSGNTSFTYNFPNDGTYTVCAPYFNENGCIDYCCETYCMRELASCLNGLIPSCDMMCLCAEAANTNLPAPFQCETFESYTDNLAVSSQSSSWTTETGFLDGSVLDLGGTEQVLHLLSDDQVDPYANYNIYDGFGDNLQCGRYRISWETFVQTGMTGAFRVLYEKDVLPTAGNTALEVYFNADSTGVVNGGEGNVTFNYRQNTWQKVMLIVDLSQDQLEFWLNDDLVYFSTHSINIEEFFNDYIWGAVHFSGDNEANYYINNICVRTKETPDCTSDGDQVCSQSGNQYDNRCLAAANGLYTGTELEACLNVCDNSALFIGREDAALITGTLNDYEPVPGAFYTDNALSGALLNYYDEVPFPLYSDYFIFENEEDGLIEINLSSSEYMAFVFQCICDESGCYSDLVGTADDILGDELDAGLYYIVIVGPQTDIPYGITVTPNSPCEIEQTIVTCGVPILNENFDNATDLSSDPGISTDCYLGSNPLTLPDKLYRLEIDTASFVDITLTVADGVGALFLYDNQCGTDCLAYRQTSIGSGTASILQASLAQGIYYIMVDQLSAVSSFDLSVECANDEENTILILFDGGNPCPTDPGIVHQLNVDLSSVNDPDLGPNDIFSLQIRPPGNTDNANDLGTNIFAHYNQVLADILVFPEIKQYNGIDIDNRCSFLPGDSVIVLLQRDNAIRVLSPVFNTPDLEPNVNAQGVYQVGGFSEIIDYELQDAGLNLLFPESFVELGPEDNLIKNLPIGIINDNTTLWDLIPLETYDWLEFTTNTTAPFTGFKSFAFEATPNADPGFVPRVAHIDFQTLEPPYVSRRLTIRQNAICVAPQTEINGLPVNTTINICEGESLALQATTAAPDSIYNFYWDNETVESGSTRVVENLPVGSFDYSLIVEQANCDAQTILIPIVVSPNLTTPTLNTTSLNTCSAQTNFVITNPQGGADYEWRNAEGDLESTDLTFQPTDEGTYSVTAVNPDNAACSSSAVLVEFTSVDLQANNNTIDSEICLGETINLIVDANISSPDLEYTWSNNINTNSNTAQYTPASAGFQTVSVVVSLDNCQTEAIPIPFNVIAEPDAPTVSSLVICEEDAPQALTVSSPNGFTIQWFDSPAASAPITTGTSFTPPTIVGTTTYWVAAIAGECTSDLISVNYTVAPTLSIGLTTDITTLCLGQTATLNSNIAPDDTPLSWSDNVTANGTFALFTPTISGMQTVSVSANNAACSVSDAVQINVLTTPDEPEVNPLIICEDDAPQALTASSAGGFDLEWFDTPTIGTPLATGINFLPPTVVGTTTFWVAAINGACVSNFAGVNYTVAPSIDLNLTSDETALCIGESTTLSTTVTPDGTPINWSDNVTPQGTTALFTATSIGTQTISVSASNMACSADESELITVDAPATFQSQPLEVPEANCESNLDGYSFEFSTEGVVQNLVELPGMVDITGETYNFHNIPVGTDFQIIIANGACIDTYNVFSPACLCTTVILAPTTDDDNVMICTGNAIPNLVVSVEDPEIYTAHWFDGEDENATLVNTGLTYNNPSPGNYFVETVDIDNACTSSDRTPVSLTIAEDIEITISQSAEVVCAGSLVNLEANANGGATPGNYNYAWSNNLSQSPNASPEIEAGLQVFFVTVTDQSEVCQNTSVVTVEGLAIPTASVSDPVCLETDAYYVDVTTDGENVSTSLGSGLVSELEDNLYRITIPSTNNIEILINNTSNGVICAYPPIVVNAPDCPCLLAGIPQVVAIEPSGIVGICAGTTSATLSVENPPDGMIVEWYSTAELEVDSYLGEGTNFEASTLGNYYAIIHDPDSDCTGSIPTTILLEELALPTVEIVTDEPVCNNESLQIQTESSGVAPLTYQWSPGEMLIDDTAANPIFMGDEGDVLLTLQITDGNGCINSDDVTITTFAPINPSIEILQEILCFGDSTGQLQANHQSPATPVLAQWSNGFNTPQISSLPAGEYMLTVIDDNSCSETVGIQLNNPPELIPGQNSILHVMQENGVVTPGALSMEVSGGTGIYSFTWVDMNGFVQSMDSVFTTEIDGDYSLIIEDENGCEIENTLILDLIVGEEYFTLAEGTVRLFPNPTNGGLHLAFDLTNTEIVTVEMLDGLGQLISAQQLEGIKDQTVQIELYHLPAGIYWISIQAGNGRTLQKILKF